MARPIMVLLLFVGTGLLACDARESERSVTDLERIRAVDTDTTEDGDPCHSEADSCSPLTDDQKADIKAALDEFVRWDEPSCAFLGEEAKRLLWNSYSFKSSDRFWYGFWKRYYVPSGGYYRTSVGYGGYHLDRIQRFQESIAKTGIHEASHNIGDDEPTADHFEAYCVNW